MKSLTFGVVFLVFLLSLQAVSGASWYIDTEKFHASIHGQFSCLDCHNDIEEQELHPNPAHVNRELKDFFKAEKCSVCHEDVYDDLKQGIHGNQKIGQDEEYGYCLRCHNPHYELSRDLKLKIGQRFDPEKPFNRQCGVCHENRTALPDVSAEDKACLTCHRARNHVDPEVSVMCLRCHDQKDEGRSEIVRIDTAGFTSSPHGKLTCLVCHPDSAQYRHAVQESLNCLDCHLPHEASVDMAAHMRISCEACHLSGIKRFRDRDSGRIYAQPDHQAGAVSKVHNLVPAQEKASCRACHKRGNTIGAAAVILPSKSLICVPCHASTLSVTSPITALSLLIFLIGVLSLVAVWMGGAVLRNRESGGTGRSFEMIIPVFKALFSFKFLVILKALFLDTLINRRLLKYSFTRWLIHSLIFLPLVFRFGWGLIALILSAAAGRWSFSWVMLDNNHALTAFLFDLTGVLVILGAALAILRRVFSRTEKVPGLPGTDWFALALIGLLLISGFFLEGGRIAMTGGSEGSRYAFLGSAVSRLFSGSSGLSVLYVHLWYLHAVLTGIFILYLPFSRMFHIIMAPISLAINAVSEHDKLHP